MATKTAKDTKDKDAEEAAPKKGKGMKIIIFVAGALLTLGAGAGGFWWFAVRTPPPPPPPEPGEVVSLEPISLNLAEGRYLKLGFSLQLVADADPEKADGSKALDYAIDTFSGRSMEELSDPVVRDTLQDELLTKVGEAYEGKVLDIYFTDFVMQ